MDRRSSGILTLSLNSLCLVSMNAFLHDRNLFISDSLNENLRYCRVDSRTFSFLFEAPKIVINQINEMIYLEKIKNTEDIEDDIKIKNNVY